MVANSAIWASVVVYLLVRLELGFKAWLAMKTPLNQVQYNELSKKLTDLQSQVNNLNISKDYN